MPSGKKQDVQVDGQTVVLSNLDKVLYPSGFTKGEVIRYYIDISDYLLPHLADRPITLKRYPNGVTAQHFYEKNAPAFTPHWIETFAVPRRYTKGTDIRYVLLNNRPSLVWSANLANLEIHPFLSRVPRLDRPTSMVFDLDPGEGADVLSCGEVAFLLREKLAAGGLQSWVKVSGSKGLQLYVPLNAAVTYTQTQFYARQLAMDLEREHPGQVVSAMAKNLRTGKVFIDWSQNSDFKTTVAVYSLRAKSSRPYVSMPVTWEELRSALRKKSAASLYFEPDAALRRLKSAGDLFAPMLSLKQKLPATARRSAAVPKGSHAA